MQGHSYQVKDLFKALLLISANDAAISLAQATGSYAKGVAMMNAEAHHLQADDTVARRPNGLNAKGQHTSAYDLALFARQALTMPAFMEDRGHPGHEVPAVPEVLGHAVEPEHHAHLPRRPGRQDRLDHPGRSHLHRLGPAARRHAHRDGPALHPADRDDRRGPAAELGLRHGRQGHRRSARWPGRCPPGRRPRTRRPTAASPAAPEPREPPRGIAAIGHRRPEARRPAGRPAGSAGRLPHGAAHGGERRPAPRGAGGRGLVVLLRRRPRGGSRPGP